MPRACQLYMCSVLLAFVPACGGTQRVRPAEGTIAGLARDRESGDPVASAEVHVRREGEMAARADKTAANGAYAVEHLAPGRYTLTAEFAGQPIDVERIDVRAGAIAVVDLAFTLGQPDPIHADFGDPKDGAIARYRSPRQSPDHAVIEGTMVDAATRGPVAGASVTATSSTGTLLTVTDAHGRYRFDAISPGTYTISAYYTLGGRGDLEIRRSAIDVRGGDGVIVPLWVELERP
jgi:hypothetical protein